MKIANHEIGNDAPLFLIAGPCAVEAGSFTIDVAGRLKEIAGGLGVFLVFKASYDKANRTSASAYRGLGIEEGLRILGEVKRQIGVPVITDVHEATPIDEVAAVVDVLQTPAFLVRQTDFIQRVAQASKPMHVKKGQFLSPWEMAQVVQKCREAGNVSVLLCERGASFGYNNLVADMRSLAVMRRTGCPVTFDATHAVQLPGAMGHASGGQREMVPVLARAAVAAGVAGVFIETHPDPDRAPSDGPTMWPLDRMNDLLATLIEIDAVVKRKPYPEDAANPRAEVTSPR